MKGVVLGGGMKMSSVEIFSQPAKSKSSCKIYICTKISYTVYRQMKYRIYCLKF